MEKVLLAILVLAIPGVLLIVRGIRMLQGGGKAWYFAKHLYAGFVYAQIPMGVALLWWFIASLPWWSQDASLVLIYIGGGIGLLGIIFNFLQPSFLKPAWLRWLEREYEEILYILKRDAYKMGLNTWEKEMETQADLEQWVSEVRRKHGL